MNWRQAKIKSFNAAMTNAKKRRYAHGPTCMKFNCFNPTDGGDYCDDCRMRRIYPSCEAEKKVRRKLFLVFCVAVLSWIGLVILS